MRALPRTLLLHSWGPVHFIWWTQAPGPILYLNIAARLLTCLRSVHQTFGNPDAIERAEQGYESAAGFLSRTSLPLTLLISSCLGAAAAWHGPQ